jgi:hypothetical protein
MASRPNAELTDADAARATKQRREIEEWNTLPLTFS